MNTYNKPYLQPYKGMHTRHICPSCGTKSSFVYYLDGNTNEIIHSTVGKCERESKCGYHYTPKQFFIDNPNDKTIIIRHDIEPKQLEPLRPIGTIPFNYVEKSASFNSHFVKFLCSLFTTEQINKAGENYALGASKTNEVIFWQLDTTGTARTAKIMQYNPTTGKRIKHESGAIDWVHNKLKKSGILPQDYNLVQCFFGEHLLTIYPTATVAIVESEKSAIIANCIMPDFIWLAAGNLNGLNIDKCKVLKGRTVVLYPDLGGFEKWRAKAIEINNSVECFITVSTLLETIATDNDRENGFDIADYLINEIKDKTPIPEIHKRFSPTLQNMINSNPALLSLIELFGFEEI